MVEWQDVLQRALQHGDPSEMKAALAAVPESVMRDAAQTFSRMADECAGEGRYEDALVYLDQLVDIEPDEALWREKRANANVKLDEPVAVIVDAERLVELRPDDAAGHRLLAEAHDGLRNRTQALVAYRRLLELDPQNAGVAKRIEYLDGELRKDAMLQRVLDPQAASADGAQAPNVLPRIEFDPALFEDLALPDAMNPSMVAGLKQHLARYGAHHSSRATLDRLADPRWLEAWDRALAAMAGARVLLHGSELGTLAIRALTHAAAHVTVVEPSPIDARIASGICQKHLLAAWHAQHGAAVQAMSEDERRASFTAFAANIDVLSPDAKELRPDSYDWIVCPNIDHTLLGTGLVRTLEAYRQRGATQARILPGRARLHAVGVQWRYPGVDIDLQDLSELRWSTYPQALNLSADGWTPLTDVAEIGVVDFDGFAETRWTCELAVIADGRLDAVLFWFDLEIGDALLSTGPDSGLRCIRPAVQYTDPLALSAGGVLPLEVHAGPSMLHVRTVPPAVTPRSGLLPSWYVPMTIDVDRNDAYRDALALRLAERRDATVLDIGAGCGLLSMMAARAGAGSVYGCEVDAPLARVAQRVVARNDAQNVVRILHRDSRRMVVPDDLPARADLVVFELFDCSLIGEGVLHYLAHAREHLMAPEAALVPMSGRIRGQVIEYRLDRIWDIDVNILNPYRFSPEFINIDAKTLDYRPLSEPFDIFSFDFATATPEPEQREIDADAIATGTAGALLFWFDLEVSPGVWLSNAPDSPQSLHWKQALQFLPEVAVEAGSTALPLSARHNGSAIAFRWRENALPAEAYSRLPRFDPRVYQQAAELQEQTANLFRHCVSDHDEYRRVADLAQRLAVDPAAHGLDPQIAQRFVSRFFANGS